MNIIRRESYWCKHTDLNSTSDTLKKVLDTLAWTAWTAWTAPGYSGVYYLIINVPNKDDDGRHRNQDDYHLRNHPDLKKKVKKTEFMGLIHCQYGFAN